MEPVLAGGDPGWIRTIDLPLRRRPLYPLSYEAPACGARHATCGQMRRRARSSSVEER